MSSSSPHSPLAGSSSSSSSVAPNLFVSVQQWLPAVVRAFSDLSQFALLCVAAACALACASLWFLGLLPYLLSFCLGGVWSVGSLAAFGFGVYKFGLATPQAVYKDGLIRASPALQHLVENLPPTSLEAQILQDKDRASITWGRLAVQVTAKKKEREVAFCALKGHTLFYQSVRGNSKVKAVLVEGAFIRFTDDRESRTPHSAFELVHPARPLMHKGEYMYFQSLDKKSLQRWYFALIASGCTPYEHLYNELALSAEQKVVRSFNSLVQDYAADNVYGQVEHGWFANMLLARMFIHLSDSASLKRKLYQKLSAKLAQKIDEKNLASKLGDITIVDLQLGTRAPVVSNFRVHKPTGMRDSAVVGYDTRVTFDFKYDQGDAAFQLKAKIILGPATVSVSGSVVLNTLHGKLQLFAAPFPMQRIELAFLEKPHVQLDIDMVVGKGINIPDKVKSLLGDKVQAILIDKLLLPHRKYILMPGVEKHYPDAPAAKFKIHTPEDEQLPAVPLSTSADPQSEEVEKLLAESFFESDEDSLSESGISSDDERALSDSLHTFKLGRKDGGNVKQRKSSVKSRKKEEREDKDKDKDDKGMRKKSSRTPKSSTFKEKDSEGSEKKETWGAWTTRQLQQMKDRKHERELEKKEREKEKEKKKKDGKVRIRDLLRSKVKGESVSEVAGDGGAGAGTSGGESASSHRHHTRDEDESLKEQEERRVKEREREKRDLEKKERDSEKLAKELERERTEKEKRDREKLKESDKLREKEREKEEKEREKEKKGKEKEKEEKEKHKKRKKSSVRLADSADSATIQLIRMSDSESSSS
eukprot:TRINITY_DN887_c0_g1_i1.p1 TRINITY_DN887_c0_g1~~TRINITY_DN887_c0_g1_i1.p1  ORF type:complete len:828 (-),score=183.20 TRINITY_DN887_c0_g1_i1:157-2604(-)